MFTVLNICSEITQSHCPIAYKVVIQFVHYICNVICNKNIYSQKKKKMAAGTLKRRIRDGISTILTNRMKFRFSSLILAGGWSARILCPGPVRTTFLSTLQCS